MKTSQVLVAAVAIALICCAVMWALEDFRQSKMIADFRAELANLPTYLDARGQNAPGA